MMLAHARVYVTDALRRRWVRHPWRRLVILAQRAGIAPKSADGTNV